MSRKVYNIYNNMVEAAKTAHVDENLTFDCASQQNEMLFFLATELAKEAVPNPLTAADPGYNEYEDVLYFYATWPDNKPNCALKKRFLLAAYNLCKAHPDNIFEKEEEPIIEVSLEDLQEKEYDETEREDAATGTYIPVKESEKVFGVLPFEEEDSFALDPEPETPKEKPRSLFNRGRRRGKR